MSWRPWVITGLIVGFFAIALRDDNTAQQRHAENQEMMAVVDDTASKSWSYRTSKDEMRSVTRYTAEIEASGDPINAPRLIIQRTGKRYDIAIRASMKSGASEFPGCIPGRQWHVNIKFDDGAVKEVRCDEGMDSLLPASLLPSLKASKVMMIEMQANGYPVQYTFLTSGLEI